MESKVYGIVGSEQAKFTTSTENIARYFIEGLIVSGNVSKIVSGECHLGGVDIYAKEQANRFMIPYEGHAPQSLSWPSYKARNIKIAKSDVIICITVDKLPSTYKGMKFEYCYHCNRADHIKSGGCWTMWYGVKRGRRGILVVVSEDKPLIIRDCFV